MIHLINREEGMSAEHYNDSGLAYFLSTDLLL